MPTFHDPKSIAGKQLPVDANTQLLVVGLSRFEKLEPVWIDLPGWRPLAPQGSA